MEMKERILEKATELFTRYGIKRITMDEIAAQLGISKKTIYHSFHDKNELVSEIFNNHICMGRHNCEVDAEKAENAVHEVLLGLDTFCTVMESINQSVLYDLEKFHPDIFKRFLDFRDQFLYTIIEKNLLRGIQEDLYRSDLDIPILIRIRLSTIVLSMNIELFPPKQFNFMKVEGAVTLHFLRGIVTEKGAQLIEKYQKHILNSNHQLN